MTDPPVWLNGTLLPQSAARLDPLAQGVLYGLGVYDALFLHRGVPIAIEQHASRLIDGADRLGLRCPDISTLTEAILAVSKACALTESRIRITLIAGAWQGPVPPAHAPQTCLITAQPITPARPQAIIVTSQWRRNERSPLAGVKFTACAENILAQRAALAAGADEALFLNTQDRLCEGAFSNIFHVRNGTVLTPPLNAGCLPGVTRKIVLALCRENNIPAREEELFPHDVPDEVFLTSSIRGIQPVSRWDDHPFPAPGEITARLMAHYAAWLEKA
jgi:branched-chain amino acid aminotransferase